MSPRTESNPVIHAEIDESKSLLLVVFAKHVGLEEARFYPEKIELLLTRLQPGFRLLADLSNLESMDFSCAPHIRRVMDLCNEKGVTMVVRIIPDPRRDIGLRVMSYFHYSHDVHIVTCENMEEANRVLTS